MCFLVGSLPNGLVFRHELAEHRSTIGRLAISTILLEEESVSALHAELIPVGDRRYLLRDLRSKNGTSVDGRKVSEAEIKAPCRLGFGHLSCELQSCDSATCMDHGKSPSPDGTSGFLQRPLAAVPGAARLVESTGRQRKSRPLSSRNRRAKRAVAPAKIDLGAASVAAPPASFRRDTSAAAFATPNKHAGGRSRLSAKALALGASIVLFCSFALGYTGIYHARGKGRVKTEAAPRLALATPAAEPVIAPPSLPALAAAETQKPEPVAEFSAPRTTEEPAFLADLTDGEPSGAASEAESARAPAPAPEPPSPAVAFAQVAPAELEVLGAEPPTANSPEPALALAPPAGDTQASEEALFVQEARLLASVSRSDSPAAPEPDRASADEAPAAPAPAESTPAVDFSMPMAGPAPRRPWEFTTTHASDLALNDLSRQFAPWSFAAGAPGANGGDLASLFRRPPLSKPPTPPAPEPPVATAPLSVMILGDSLALCGFGNRLDHRFRESPNVRATNTYMACGTVPMSWLKEAPYGNIKTYCGFWTIESPLNGGARPANFQDTYGMGKGKPKPYLVPKLDDLFAKTSPDILVLQTGTNLFSLFRDGQTVQPEHHAPMLRKQIEPFLNKILNLPNPPRAIYWVASPTSGRVSTEVQDFVIQQITNLVGPMAKVIDSRTLVSFPYKHMEPDKEHFIGADMDQWADRVFDIVQRDLSAHPLPLALARPPGLPAGKPAPIAARAAGKLSANDPTAICVTAKLVGKSKPIPLEQLRPYQESMVSFVYEVHKVTQGEYSDEKILVMHPAHIGLKSQPLDKFRVGKTYELRLHELEGSPWNTVKSRDDFRLNELLPYIQVDDEARFPAHDP